jgi:membrane-associated protease RseP (regulator of RpoE activity)
VVDVTLSDKDYGAAFETLVPQYDEPIGLAVLANNPKLGLLKGDLVRAINGEAVQRSPTFRFRTDVPLIYLDVLRGGKVVVVRVLVTKDSLEEHMERDRFKEHLEMAAKFGAADMFHAVTKGGNPSGVVVGGWFPPLVDGDIIRKIDGASVATPEDAVAALEKATDHAQVVFDAERLGKPMTARLIIDTPVSLDPALLSQIKKLNDTTYEVGKDVIDAVLQNPMAVAKGARVVPAVKDGKPVGFKLYAIRPSSIFSTLGFENGDTLQKINGSELTSADKALEIYTKLRDAKKLTVEIERRGKPITQTYTIK